MFNTHTMNGGSAEVAILHTVKAMTTTLMPTKTP